MTAKKRSARLEPLLNTVARRLGHAAGTFTKVTHDLTESLTALPTVVSAKVREAAQAAPTKATVRRTWSAKAPRRPTRNTGKTTTKRSSTAAGKKSSNKRSVKPTRERSARKS